MEIKRHKFSVEVIEKIGEKGMREAWLTSKPTLHYSSERDLERDLSNVINDDLPIVGFHVYALKIKSSLLFRDLIFSVRPVNPWATSGRILKAENMGLEEFEGRDTSIADDAYRLVCKRQDDGEALDVTKRDLPLLTMTEYCITIDLRTLVAFVKALKEMDEYLYKSHGLVLLAAIGLDEKSAMKIRSHSIYNKLAIPEDKYSIMHEKFQSSDRKAIYTPSSVSYELWVNVAASLGAQFIRQHYAKVRNGMFNAIKKFSYYNVAQLPCSHVFMFCSYGDKEQYEQLVSRRVCWVAQFDWDDQYGWGSIIGDTIKGLTPDQFMQLLPCKGCGRDCSVEDETKLRLYSKRPDKNRIKGNVPDENPPCPFITEDPSMIDLRQKMYQSTGAIFDSWKDLVKEKITLNVNNDKYRYYNNLSDLDPYLSEKNSEEGGLIKGIFNLLK